MRHYVYEITHKLTGKRYVGIHSCSGDFLLGDYYGSGVAITRAVRKHGKDSFVRKVLLEAPSKEAAAELEELIVDTAFILRRDTYNLVTGGGNPPQWEGPRHAYDNAFRQKISAAQRGRIHSREAVAKRVRYGDAHHMFGKHHSEKTRALLRSKNSGENSGMWGKEQTAATKIAISEKKAKEYTLLNPEGIPTRITNMRQFCLANGLSDGHMISVFKGKRNVHKGWRKYEP